jgi:hypothetical protein
LGVTAVSQVFLSLIPLHLIQSEARRYGNLLAKLLI